MSTGYGKTSEWASLLGDLFHIGAKIGGYLLEKDPQYNFLNTLVESYDKLKSNLYSDNPLVREQTKSLIGLINEYLKTDTFGRLKYVGKKLLDAYNSPEIRELVKPVASIIGDCFKLYYKNKEGKEVGIGDVYKIVKNLRDWVDTLEKKGTPISKLFSSIRKGLDIRKNYEKLGEISKLLTIPILLGFLAFFHYVDFSTQGMFLATGPAQISYLIIACMLLVVLFYYLFKKK